jgi:hypothetical protein
MLCGLYKPEGLAEALVDLLRSEEPIDRHVRDELARRLEAEIAGDATALRLRVVRADGGSRTWEDTVEQMHGMQAIADRFSELREAGLTR